MHTWGEPPPTDSRAAPLDWSAAAQALIDACASLDTPQSRVDYLQQLCDALGPDGYVALLGVLCVVGARGTASAQACVSLALTDALRSGRLPVGRRAAWGGASAVSSRSVGPLEYLCARFAESPGADTQRVSDFRASLRALLVLLSGHDVTRHLYCERLDTLADDPLTDGALSHATRERLAELARAWRGCGSDWSQAIEAFLATAAPPSLAELRHLGGAHRPL